MKRFAMLSLAAALFVVPASGHAAATDGVPLMPVNDMKVLPGTPVPITPPAPPQPSAPVAKSPMTKLPGQLIPVVAPPLRR